MSAMVQTLNTAGRDFVGFALPMLIQSSLLILILLVVNSILRTRVRAVFRYWIWMLVLVKLVLPPSLWSPVSLGTWFGDKLEVPTTALLEAPESSPVESPSVELSPAMANVFSRPPRMFVDPPRPEPMAAPPSPLPTEVTERAAPMDLLPAVSLNWQGFVLLAWLAVVTALLLLLAQRTFFVRSLVAQAEEAGGAMLRELNQCRQRLGLRRPIALRLSPNAVSPAVCGLIRPVILVPQNLASRLHGTDLQAVLFHELAHVRRGDLWLNLVQTLLQIVYFYNPLVWLANAIIRRIREEAVDETVLVALGEAAPQYPDTLINVAKLALARRPVLSLRLVGVVESKSALTSRVKHILNRPLPKSARLGLLGVLVVFLVAAVLLPMAKGNALGGWFGGDAFVRFRSEDKANGVYRTVGDTEIRSKEYTVSIKSGEALAVVAELYQVGRPMRTLGGKTFSNPGRPERLSAVLRTRYLNQDKTATEHAIEIALGGESLRVSGIRVDTARSFNNVDWGFFPGSEIAARRRDGKPSVDFANLLFLRACSNGGQPRAPRIWMPGVDISWVDSDAYFLVIRMLPPSQVDHLRIEGPVAEQTQLPDGTILPPQAAQEQRQAVADAYVLNLKRLVMREHMPVKKLLAHQYYQAGGPIWLYADGIPNSSWQPKDLHPNPGPWPYLLLIDGREYSCSQGFGPFDGVGGSLDIWDNIYVRPGDSPLGLGRHVVAYGWKNLDVVDPNDPDKPLHFDRLLSDPVEFEVVEQVPQGYYRQVYQEGWEDILRRSMQTPFSDAPEKHGLAGPLLTLSIRPLPFDGAFGIYAQAEGSGQRQHAGQIATRAGSLSTSTAVCDRNVEGLNWDTVGDKRWRLILVPSEKVAAQNPPIHEFYGREFVTDWVSFERSPQFEQHRLEFEHRRDKKPEEAPPGAQQHQSVSTPASGLTASDSSRDSDGDGLSDFDEIHKYLTDPMKKDSDGDGVPDGDWNERREYAYSVRTILRYMPPFDEKGLNDDFQDGRVLKRTNDYIEIEAIHYPFATGQESLPENRNWRRDDAQMTEYLAPGAATNWDEAMRRDLLAALKADGIDVETLTDKQVVERVSRWLLDRSRYLDKAFTTWFVHFPQGKPTIYPGLEEAFRREFERDSSNYNWTLDQHFDHEVLGKGMFYNKTHGSCTSTAVYLTTVLRALGIPTRMILAAPAVDASDSEQMPLVRKAITHNRARLTMLAGLNRASRGTTNHIFNEVYLGNRWCRLDYTQLGCPNFGLHRFGLQTHLYTFNDLSDANLAPTWGRRYAKGEHSDVFRQDNPYTAVEVSELFGPHGQIPNPPCTAQELDSHPQPDVFLFYPARGDNVWDGFVGTVKGWAANKTGRYQQKESYENLFDGTWLVRPQDFVILLFSLDTPERIPEGYEDLLPKPWPEIEAQLRQGQTVELAGKAREKNVILLAAPTAEGLKPLVQNSKLLQAIGGSSPSPTASSSAGATQTRVLPQSASEPVKVPDGVTVELLGVSQHPSEGKLWWKADGSPQGMAPYHTGRVQLSREEGHENYELVSWVSGPPDTSILWKVAGYTRSTQAYQPSVEREGRLGRVSIGVVDQRASAEMTNVFVGVAAGPWQTMATHTAPNQEGSYTLPGGKAVAFGLAYEKDGDTYVPTTTTTSLQAHEVDWRVVAVDEEGNLHTDVMNSRTGGDILRSATSRVRVPLHHVKAFLFQTRPWTWVAYKRVSLRPGHLTKVAVELPDSQTMMRQSLQVPGQRAPGAGKVVAIGPAWEVLKEVLGPRLWGSIGGFGQDPVETKQYFDKLLARMSPGDTFVLMFAFDKPVGTPPEYRDLLPLPWSEIESRVREGQTVEAQGQARDLTVIVLAAPTSGRLEALIRQTHLLDPYRPETGKTAAVPSAEQEREIVLPEADRQQVILDLATGQLVPLPPVGPEPEKMEQALRKLGKGDLLYDCDQGDRTLILMRGATSEQAQGDTGEPSWKGYLIGPYLPAVLTVNTAEGRQYRITILAADDKACTLKYSPVSTGKGTGGGALAAPEKTDARANEDRLKQLLADARPGSVVVVPAGRYTTPVEITKPVTLRGESAQECIVEVTADQPALLVNAQGQGQVTIENLTVRWQLTGKAKTDLPAALLVKGSNALIRNCRFAPLGDFKRSPMAVYIDRPSKSTVDNCRFSGSDYVVCYGQGTEGTVQDCLIADCGHQGVINYDGAILTVQRNIITGSKFHAVRCTGGVLTVKDNLLIKNVNRGIYLGNKTGRGTITNNLIVGNGTGISGFGGADYTIANNVVMDNSFAGIDMRDSCRFSIRNNLLVKNQRGLALFKEGTENTNVVAANLFWSNATDVQDLERPPNSLTADPQFTDPNHGDFTVRGLAQAQGHGLTNPQVLKDLWQRYEQLQRERPTPVDVVSQSPSAPAPSPASAVLAWQRTDRYVPPDPNGFFPDDPEAGKRLDSLYRAVDKDQRSDEEILSTVRQGFRRTTQDRALVLRWIGNRYIWNQDPQNARAVEIMYHAVPLEQSDAVYFGLSVVRDKPANVLRTLADVCMQSSDEVGRITSGLGSQREALLPYLTPYLQDPDGAKRELAGVLVKHFKGELDFDQWRRQKGLEQVKVQFAGQAPQFKQTLLTGDSEARYRALAVLVPLMRTAGGLMFLDDSLLSAFLAASTDPDPRVRNAVAWIAGHRWIWTAPRQDPNAIALMLKLSADSNREVRYNAVYYGLSVVRDKSEPIIRRLVEMALADHENNLHGRIVWGLRRMSTNTSDTLDRVLAEEFGRAKTDVHHAAVVYALYREVLEKEPPVDWDLARVRERYPDDLFVLPVSAREPFQPKDVDALWSEFVRALPAGTAAERLSSWYTNEEHACYARIRGKEQAETIRNAVGSHPRLRAGEIHPLTLTAQLYLEEQQGTAPGGASITSSPSSPNIPTRARRSAPPR